MVSLENKTIKQEPVILQPEKIQGPDERQLIHQEQITNIPKLKPSERMNQPNGPTYMGPNIAVINPVENKTPFVLKMTKGLIMLWNIAGIFLLTIAGASLVDKTGITYLPYVLLIIQLLSCVGLFFFLTKNKKR